MCLGGNRVGRQNSISLLKWHQAILGYFPVGMQEKKKDIKGGFRSLISPRAINGASGAYSTLKADSQRWYSCKFHLCKGNRSWWGSYWLRAAIAHPKPGPWRFMCFSQRFIFALMPFCSALYWCFCHVVKIYGAISLAWNGLIEVSARADLWPNMGVRGKKRRERKSGKLINLYLYFDLWRPLTFFSKKKKKKTETRRDTNKSRLSNFKFRTSMKSLIHVLVRDVKSSRAVIDVLITPLKQLDLLSRPVRLLTQLLSLMKM